MRLMLAFVTAGVGIGLAVALYAGTAKRQCASPFNPYVTCARFTTRTPAWAKGAAVVVAFVGVGAGVAIGRAGAGVGDASRDAPG